MTRRRRQFSPEFKEEAVRMVLEGDRTVASVAREFDINGSTLGSWVSRHRIVNAQDEQPGPVAGPDRARIRELERENTSVTPQIVTPFCDTPRMLNVELLRPLLRAAWGPDTCDPVSREQWQPDNPARGQCGTTALVVQDLLGGDLILAEVHVGGAKVWNHYWNRLPDDTEVDFTSDQFHPGEVVVGGRVQQRPPDAPRRCREEYELLRQRVLSALASPRLD